MMETNYHSFIVLKKQTVLGGTCKLNKEFFKNLSIKYVERTINWNLPRGETTSKRKFAARECK